MPVMQTHSDMPIDWSNNMMNRRQFLTSVTVALSLATLPGKNVWAAVGGDGLMLDLAEAMKVHEQSPPNLFLYSDGIYGSDDLDLSAYARATPEALEFLKSHGYNSRVEIGFVELGINIASVLGRWDASYTFTNLDHIDVDAAALLSDGNGIRSFDKLMNVPPELARELAKQDSILSLRMDSISLDVAGELVKQADMLYLELKVPPSESVLQILTTHAGHYLQIGGWETQLGNTLRNFEPTNTEKTVEFGQYQNEAGGKYMGWILIEEDLGLWVKKRNLWVEKYNLSLDSVAPSSGCRDEG